MSWHKHCLIADSCVLLLHSAALLQVNRCVRCANSGTFSLHPDRPCQPCVPGGLCSKGLLQPREGYWSSNPFVPQVIPCPLQGACSDRNLSSEEFTALVPWLGLLQQEQEQVSQQLQQHHQQHQQQQQPLGNWSSAAGGRRVLLQASTAAGSPPDSVVSESTKQRQQQQQEQPRAEALQQYNRHLADLITFDPEEGPFKLYNVSYGDLVGSWQGLQCNKG